MNTTAPRFRCLGCSHTFRADSLPTGPEGCPECGGGHFEELPISPLPCPAGCDEGRALSRDGSHSFACAACRGSGVARCTVCRKGDAVLDDGEELVCAGCVAEIAADEVADRVAREATAILLPVLTYAALRVAIAVSLERMRRAAGLSRHCTPPPPPPVAPTLPQLARRDPDSSTWRAMRATSIETVRPGGVL